jgi:transcription elongation factor Elf1
MPESSAASVADATARFECLRLGHEPSFTITTPVTVESWVCACARCGRLVEFKTPEVKRVN